MSEVGSLVTEKYSEYVVYPFITQYSVWMFIAVLLTIGLVFWAAKKQRMVPQGLIGNGFEAMYCGIQSSVIEGVVGPGWKKHAPFLMTIFLFILVSNLVGLVPGVKVPTGTMGVTVALATISFIYFNYYGIKKVGFLRYARNLAPRGIVLPIAVLIWFIELLSLFLRLVTLAVRLFANMLAGHMVLGAFALLSTCFFLPVITNFTLANLAAGSATIAWMLLLIAMYAMELLVAIIQAYVFTVLSAVYVGLAINPSH